MENEQTEQIRRQIMDQVPDLDREQLEMLRLFLGLLRGLTENRKRDTGPGREGSGSDL